MPPDPEVHAFLLRHLQAIQANDLETYHATTAAELTLYEWWVTPHRLEGIEFHDYMMQDNQTRGTVFGSAPEAGDQPAVPPRLDLANLLIQRYGDCAVASYTLLVSSRGPAGVTVMAHNESRVMVKKDGAWKVVHVHKSPAWPAPHVQPA